MSAFDRLKRDLLHPDSPAQEPPPGERLGRYTVVRSVGRGGMGVVYEATDPDLGRRVALKIIRDAPPSLVDRLQREAMAAGRLKHPGIVAVHESGVIADASGATVHYIAMDFIDGPALATLLPTLNRRQRLEVLADVATAAGFAHAHGVVHRDLKPQNILLERLPKAASSGLAWRPTLVDFGLAKVEQADDLTRPGTVIGTARYMAPEQVRAEGERIGPWTDVWALGAILYECLCDHGPFDAETAPQIYTRILGEEPESPRRLAQALHPDLETICLRALEKDPGRRYPDGEALAQDVRRYLADEPILARPPSIAERLVRKLRRNPVAWVGVTAAAAGAIAALIMGGVSLDRDRRAQEARTMALQQRAEAVRALRQEAATCVQGALRLRRQGALADMLWFRDRLHAAYARAAQAAPDDPEVEFWIGRMYRALMQDELALQHQERALTHDPAFAPARFERGLLLLQRYEERLQDRRTAWWRERGQALARAGGGEIRPGAGVASPDRDALIDPATRVLRDRAEADLTIAAERCEPGFAHCAQGLLALAGGRLDEAEFALQRALETTPDLEEAVVALARLAQNRDNLKGTIAWCTRGLENDRGYVPFRRLRAAARQELGSREAAAGRDPGSDYEGAIADYGEALALSPQADLLEGRAFVRLRWAQAVAACGGDGWSHLEAAIADFTEALRLQPSRAPSHQGRGAARREMGEMARGRGRGSEDLLAAALDDYDRAIRLDPARDAGWSGRGYARLSQAMAAAQGGGDAEALFAAAEEDFNRALELNPSSVDRWCDRGYARFAWANERHRRGRDPSELYLRTIADYAQALDIDATDSAPWENRAGARVNLALWLESHGQNPGQVYREALDDFGQAIQRNPHRASTLVNRATARLAWATSREDTADQQFAEALRDLDRALELNPRMVTALNTRAAARLDRGLRRPAERDILLPAALKDLDASIEVNPGLGDTWLTRGKVLTLQRNHDEALSSLGRALEIDPRNGGALEQRGSLLLALRRYEDALKDLEAAVSADPRAEGRLRSAIAMCKRALGKP